MPDRAPWPRPPRVLIAHGEEWSARSLESILVPNGYQILRAYTAAQALERVASVEPDVVIVADQLPDAEGLDVCRALRDGALIPAITPILMMFASHPPKLQRLTVLRSGVREILTQPLDAEELLLKLGAYVEAQLEAERMRHASLLDQASELYSPEGLARRARELVATASRHGAPLACVVFGVDTGSEENEAAVLSYVADALRKSGRTSDAIGRVSKSEFAVLAPATDAEGADMLATRLVKAMNTGQAQAGRIKPKLGVRAGYEAVSDMRAAPIEPSALVERARAAVQTLYAQGSVERVRRYEPRRGMT